MKKIYITAGLLLLGITASAQVLSNGQVKQDLLKTNYFLDASNFKTQADTSVGKLLGFPQTDLTKFAFKLGVIEDEVVASGFDGVIVYNTATGQTGSNLNTQGIQVDVTPGFYYFSNPNGATTQSVRQGKWVRLGSENVDQLWAQRNNNGVTETYLKPADANGDQFYYSNKESVLNLGNVDLSELKENSRTQPYIFDKETPHLLLINSSKFPETTTAYDKGARYYHFSREAFQVKNDHASIGIDAGNKRYLGKEFLAFASDLTARIHYLVGSNNLASFQSSSEAEQVVGGRFFTVVGNRLNTLNPKVKETIGVSSYPTVYGGEVARMRGFVTSPLVYGGSIEDLRGVHTNVESMRQEENSTYATANYNHISGYSTTLFVRPNTTATYTYGADITNTFDGQSAITRGVGVMNRGIFNANSNVSQYSAYTAHLGAKNNAVVGELYGLRLTTDFEDSFAPTKMFGLHLANINKGAENYAIYTNAGLNSFGDRVQIRVVDDVDLQSDAAFMIGNKTGVNLALDNNELQSRNNGASSLFAINPHGGDVFFNNQDADETKRFHFRSETGNVGIGVGNPSEKLEVAGKVKATAFMGTNGATIFPDYVFQKYYTGISNIKSDYNFKSLSQVEDFVKANGHLPGYKSAETIKAQGYVDLMETQLTNVEKIEELYLHSIEQDKVNKQQAEALRAKDAEIADLKQRLERLEKLIQ